MPIESTCDGCGKTIWIKEQGTGLGGRCPRCKSGSNETGRDFQPGPVLMRSDPTLQAVGSGPKDQSARGNSSGLIDAMRIPVAFASCLSLFAIAIHYSGSSDKNAKVGKDESGRPKQKIDKVAIAKAVETMQLPIDPGEGISSPGEVRPTPVLPSPVRAPRVETPPSLNVQDRLDRVETGVALIRGPESIGSGFLVKTGILATTAHVIVRTEPDKIQVAFLSGPEKRRGPYSAKVLYFDQVFDLAILAVETSIPSLELDRSSALKTGLEVSSLDDSTGEIRRSAIKSHVSLGKSYLFQINPPIPSDRPGGPVLDVNGRVVGIATFLGTQVPEMGFCIPLNKINTAIEKVDKMTPAQLAAEASRHAEASRLALLGQEAPGQMGRAEAMAAIKPTVLAPSKGYVAFPGKKGCVVRDLTPATASWAGLDDFAWYELAGDRDRIAEEEESLGLVWIPRGLDVEIVEVKDPASSGQTPVAFEAEHPAGVALAVRPLYGPLEGKTLYFSSTDVGRLRVYPKDSEEGLNGMKYVVRSPRIPKTDAKKVAKADSAFQLADAKTKTSKPVDVLKAFGDIVRQYPYTKAASKAKIRLEEAKSKEKKPQR